MSIYSSSLWSESSDGMIDGLSEPILMGEASLEPKKIVCSLNANALHQRWGGRKCFRNVLFLTNIFVGYFQT